MREAVVPGHRNFRAIACDPDIGWMLFSYDLPIEFDVSTAIPFLRTRIRSTILPAYRGDIKPTCWRVVKEEVTHLQLQCDTVTYGSSGYDEWRLRVDPRRRRVTAMYSNLDSPAERDRYPELLASFEKAYAAE